MGVDATAGIEDLSSDEARLAYRRRLRRESVEKRQALPPEMHAQFSSVICGYLRTAFPQLARKRVAYCWPVKNEPDLRPLMASWLAQNLQGFAALLPVVVGSERPLAFRAWTPRSPLVPDAYGIPTPEDGEFLVPDALLLPTNAFDAAGYRIGYGGGFFDRTLASLQPRPLAIGVGFELARVESIAPMVHDVPLDAMVTEAGVFYPKT